MIKLSYQQVVDLKPCSIDKIPDFGLNRTLSAEQALDLGVPIEYILWVAAKLGLQDLCVRFALACAERVKDLNTDPLLQKALDATQSWLDDPNDGNAAACAAAYHAAEGHGDRDYKYILNVSTPYGIYAATEAIHAASYAALSAASRYVAASYATSAASYATKAVTCAIPGFYAQRLWAGVRELTEQKQILIKIFS